MTKKRTASTIGIVELLTMFSTEAKAVKWLERVRWNGKPVCPKCGGTDKIKTRKAHSFSYICNPCRYTFTVKTNTIMHRSPIEVKIWAIAIYMVMTARKSVSSLQLSKELGITQKSAWFMVHRIREACKSGDFVLSDIVEVDETYIGGKEKNKHANKKLNAGRGIAGKKAVIGIRERGGKVKAKHVSGTDRDTLQGFITDNVAEGSNGIYTDDHRAYIGLRQS